MLSGCGVAWLELIAVAEQSTFVKLDRNLLKWRWFQHPKTLAVWLWLIMKANVEPHDFEKETIQRGEVATSRKRISADTGLTEREVRTALEHLKSTGEVSVRIRPKYQVISILEYSKYQDVQSGKASGKRPASVRQESGKRPQYKNVKNDKNEKNEKNVCATHTPPDRAEVEAYAESQGIRTDVAAFIQYNDARGWKGIVDWRPLLLKWASHDGNEKQNNAEELDDFGRPIKKEFV